MIGLLGGTFDPPHNGHLALANGALAELGIDELLIMLVASPGHRSCTLDAETRLRLVQAAFKGAPRTRIVRDDHPYTVDALVPPGVGDLIRRESLYRR